MICDYTCTSCGNRFEELVPMIDRDKPTLAPCPKCSMVGKIIREIGAPSISYLGFKSTVTRAGTGWRDVLRKIKSGAGRNNTIQAD